MEKPERPRKQRKSAAATAAAKSKSRDPTNRQRLQTPNVPRTRVFTLLSLSLLVFLVVVLLYDLVQLAIKQHPQETTQSFSVAILVSVNVNQKQAILGKRLVGLRALSNGVISNINKAFVDITLRPRCAIPPPHPHRLLPEILRILFALAWHTEWSRLLHDATGNGNDPCCREHDSDAAATAAVKIANTFEWSWITEFGSFRGVLRNSVWQSHNYGQFTITMSSSKRL